MRDARFILLLVALTLPLSGYMSCGSPGPIQSVTPARDEVVTDPSFDVGVELHDTAIPATLTATLNGQALALSGGPTVFATTVDPGPPLLDDNVLVVTVMSVNQFAQIKTIPFQYLPPKARARRITDPADLITGPLAHGRLNDLLLENDVARFIIQDAPQRDLHSVGQFGGNIIDAEVVENGVRQGNDNFLEVQPAANIEGVINADEVEILNDGENGLPAQIRACGPDDLLDYVNASSEVGSLGVTLPVGTDDTDLDLDGCTTYTLAPGDRHVTMETTVTYNSGSPVGLYLGDYLNGAGELEQWTSNEPIFGIPGSPQGIGELLANASFEVFSYFGFGQGTGVDYALIPQLIPGATYPISSSFSTSGVSFVLAGSSLPLLLGGFYVPTFYAVPAGESRSFTRLFHVGDGSPANAVDLDLAEDGVTRGTLEGYVTVDGVPAPGARVVAGPESGGSITDLTSIWVTDASGYYSGQLPVGSYGVAAGLEGVPYQGGGSAPDVNCTPTCAAITDGGVTTLDIDLPATGRVRVTVVDGQSDPIPARVSVVGFDPSPEPNLTFTLPPLSPSTVGVFRDVKDRVSYGLVWIEYAGADGIAEFDLDPGSYQIFVSRGTEYSLFQQPLTVSSGPFGSVTETVNAQIVPVVDSSGFVSSDFHVHMIDSPDSRISQENRVRSFAGEGVDNLVATDHDAVTDLAPVISTLNLVPFLHSTIGEEITSFDYGHYNAFPQAVDPGVPSGGSTDWAGAALVGQDFPSLGSYCLTPAEIEDQARNKLASDASVQNAGLTTAVQINHIDSHFEPLRIDTSLEPPVSVLDPLAFDVAGNPEPINPLFYRLDPSVSNFFNVFDGLEIWNGSSQGSQDKFMERVMGIWMNHLNQGIAITATAVTDTHTFYNLETAGPRTWTPTSTGSDSPADILDNDIGQAIQDSRAVSGQGVYLQARLVDTDVLPEATADFSWLGSTLVTATDGTVDLVIDVQAPTWAPYDTIEIYTNAQTCVASYNEGVPVLFGGIADQTLTAGTDFTVSTVNLPNGGQRLETHHTMSLTLAEDTWVAVFARGTQGATGSPPMFPVFPYSLSSAENPDLTALLDNTATENGTRALGFTNALYVDIDGNAQFDPPGCAGRCGAVDCP